eukprot:CAMPEP_0114233478 /NCGR_PEP_ID=MMETSP0058-20121206/5188_1 /TAXON_ID=36894 /ORGANISM="Pyramimonas parkeae, CCMP726" /LENGTH=424 /DNA_ID=CAMNT_0001345075 /DNA_START=579 /DNA_END=1853 /DNA_ORIENTATION=-
MVGLGLFSETDLKNFAYVNKRFCKLAHEMGLHSSLHIQGAHANTPRLVFAASNGRFRYLTSLSIQEAPFCTDEGLVAIASNCPSLCTVTLTRCVGVRGAGLASLIFLCQGLQTLQVRVSQLGPLDARDICRAILGLRPWTQNLNATLPVLNHSRSCNTSTDFDFAVPGRRHTADSDIYAEDASVLVAGNRAKSSGTGIQPTHQAESHGIADITESFRMLSTHTDGVSSKRLECGFDIGEGGIRIAEHQDHIKSGRNKGVSGMHSLRTLDLMGNRIGTAGGSAFAQLIQKNPPLETLGLLHNQLGSAAVSEIGVALSHNTHLKTLLLGANYTDKEYIQPSAVHAVVQGLGRNSHLQMLDLSLNGLDAIWFGKSFRALNHPNLRKVDLSGISDAIRCIGGSYSPFAPDAGSGVIFLQSDTANGFEI